MDKVKYLYLVLSILIITSLLLYFKNFTEHKSLVHVKGFTGNNLIISTDSIHLQLAGIYIPNSKNVNYRKELRDNIETILKNQEFYIKVIEKKQDVYPRHDMVMLYETKNSKESINEKLLKEGMAFFDQGYYRRHKHFWKLQNNAREKKIGLWHSKNYPTVIFIGSKNWEGVHWAECPRTKEIKKRDRIYYYFTPPSIFYYRAYDIDCSYCYELENQKGWKRPIHKLD